MGQWLQPGGQGPQEPREGVGPSGAIRVEDETWSDLCLSKIIPGPGRRGCWNGERLVAKTVREACAKTLTRADASVKAVGLLFPFVSVAKSF